MGMHSARLPRKPWTSMLKTVGAPVNTDSVLGSARGDKVLNSSDCVPRVMMMSACHLIVSVVQFRGRCHALDAARNSGAHNDDDTVRGTRLQEAPLSSVEMAGSKSGGGPAMGHPSKTPHQSGDATMHKPAARQPVGLSQNGYGAWGSRNHGSH